MSLKPKPFPPISPELNHLAEAILPADNLYRHIGEKLADFIADDAFVALYSREGKPALSPALLAMVTVFQAVENVSDRQAALLVVMRLDWKYALHLPLDYAGFHYSVLREFRDRLVTHQAQSLVFDQLLNKLKALGLVRARGQQRTDSLAIISAVRRLSRLELLIETLRLALSALEVALPEWFLTTVPKEGGERYGGIAQHERLVSEKGEKGQAEALRLSEQTALDGVWLLEQLRASEQAKNGLELEAVCILSQVWEQQIEVSPPGVRLREPEKLAKASALISSPHDPEARYSEKRGKGWQGYKMHLSETVEADKPHIITDVTTTLATESDHQALGTIQRSLSERSLTPGLQIVDSAYVSGENLASSKAKAISLYGPVSRDSSWQARSEGGLALAQFELNYPLKQARCPAGATSQYWSGGGSGSGSEPSGVGVINIRFSKEECGGCELRARCMQGPASKTGRSLKLKPQHELVAARRLEQETDEFKKHYAQRAGVEASLSELVRGSGVRVTRYIGLAKVRLGNLLKGAGTNLKRAAKWLAGLRPVATRAKGLRSLGK